MNNSYSKSLRQCSNKNEFVVCTQRVAVKNPLNQKPKKAGRNAHASGLL